MLEEITLRRHIFEMGLTVSDEMCNSSGITTIKVTTNNELTKPEIAKITKCTSIWTRATLL